VLSNCKLLQCQTHAPNSVEEDSSIPSLQMACMELNFGAKDNRLCSPASSPPSVSCGPVILSTHLRKDIANFWKDSNLRQESCFFTTVDCPLCPNLPKLVCGRIGCIPAPPNGQAGTRSGKAGCPDSHRGGHRGLHNAPGCDRPGRGKAGSRYSGRGWPD
jgi:hypothetical protein